MPDNPRLDNLRRRVETDPASIAFAQLGEELRRAGLFQEAIDVCRAGLAIHPAYASARVTLGRALLDLDELDAAATELALALEQAPDNLAAIRSLAVIHRRRGDLSKALSSYRAALQLAPYDSGLERTVADLVKESETPAVVPVGPVGNAAPGPAVSEPPAGGTLSPATDDSAVRTLAALEQWLAAVHVARAQRHS